MTEPFEHFFKPEVRASGEDLISSGAFYLKVGTDTQIEATIRGSTPVHVTFRSASIESPDFTVDCSCKASANGQMCKHIWATLVAASEKQPDFFAEKTSLSKGEVFADRAAAKAASLSPEALQRQTDFKARQTELRKQSYEAKKARAKELKARTGGGGFGRSGTAGRGARESRNSAPSKSEMFLPEKVQLALKYFEANCFPLTLPINEEELGNAKRILARVFHPDKGGSTEEAVELMRHSEVLSKHR